MRIYDVYFYGEPHATVSVQEDGQKVWTLDGWANFQLDHDTQTKIEQMRLPSRDCTMLEMLDI
jgi:hypothetical protein